MSDVEHFVGAFRIDGSTTIRQLGYEHIQAIFPFFWRASTGGIEAISSSSRISRNK